MTKWIRIPIELLEELAPEEPMNQDELGGCVWCGGTPKGKEYGYATANPKDHATDCPWVKTRILISGKRDIVSD